VGGYDLARAMPGLDNYLILAFTEMTTRQEIDDLAATLRDLLPEQASAGSQAALQGAGTRGKA